MKRFLRFDWDAIAGVVLLALLFLRDLRRERHTERLNEHVSQIATAVTALQSTLRPPDALLGGPRQIRAVTTDFASRAHGDMLWFHVCLLMFKPQPLFD